MLIMDFDCFAVFHFLCGLPEVFRNLWVLQAAHYSVNEFVTAGIENLERMPRTLARSDAGKPSSSLTISAALISTMCWNSDARASWKAPGRPISHLANYAQKGYARLNYE